MTLFSTEKTYGALRGNVLNDTFLLRWFGGDHRNRKFSFSPLFRNQYFIRIEELQLAKIYIF